MYKYNSLCKDALMRNNSNGRFFYREECFSVGKTIFVAPALSLFQARCTGSKQVLIGYVLNKI